MELHILIGPRPMLGNGDLEILQRLFIRLSSDCVRRLAANAVYSLSTEIMNSISWARSSRSSKSGCSLKPG